MSLYYTVIQILVHKMMNDELINTFLRWTHRSEAVLPVDAVQAPGVKRDTQEQHAQALRIIPFHSEDKLLDLDALKHRYKTGTVN